MEIKTALNPVWTNPENTQINLTVQFGHINGMIPFTACPNDVEEHGRDLYARAIAGEFGPIAAYIPPSPGP